MGVEQLLSFQISLLGEDSCPGVISITNNKSIFDPVHSAKLTLDRRLRLDISAVREMCEREEVCLQWIETHGQLSDVLMKKDASSASLVATLRREKTDIIIFKITQVVLTLKLFGLICGD